MKKLNKLAQDEQVNEELVKVDKIENSPFHFVKRNGEEKGFITMGQYAVSEIVFDTIVEAKDDLTVNIYDYMFKIALVVANDIINTKKVEE